LVAGVLTNHISGDEYAQSSILGGLTYQATMLGNGSTLEGLPALATQMATNVVEEVGVFADRLAEGDYEAWGQLSFDGGLAFAGTALTTASFCAKAKAATAVAKTEANLTRGWKLGDPINNLTSKGNVPAWGTVRQRFWKNEALNNPGEYNADNVSRMQRGLAPQRLNEATGKWESMELHHTPAQRDGGLFDVQKVWPDEHALIDPYRRTGN